MNFKEVKLKQWTPLEHALYRKWKDLPTLYSKKIMVGLSGGIDSVALLVALKRIQSKACAFHLSAIYVHHGFNTENSEQNQYRDHAKVFCTQLCERLNVKIELPIPSTIILKSEEEYRNFRLQQFLNYQDCAIALAHHADDVLETRLLRLIRGTSLDGLEAIKEWTPELKFWRPFLELSKNELFDYIKLQNESFLEDPSNKNNNYFRNWLRNHWLEELESHQKGAVKSLSRSLDNIVNQWHGAKSGYLKINISNVDGSDYAISRNQYLALTVDEQKQIVIELIKKLNILHFTHGQIKEILKHLDNSQRVFTFKSCNAYWFVDAEQIKISSIK